MYWKYLFLNNFISLLLGKAVLTSVKFVSDFIIYSLSFILCVSMSIYKLYDTQIREETQTKIDLPAEGEKSDVITITGKKENVEKAKEMIQKIQNELVIIITMLCMK